MKALKRLFARSSKSGSPTDELEVDTEHPEEEQEATSGVAATEAETAAIEKQQEKKGASSDEKKETTRRRMSSGHNKEAADAVEKKLSNRKTKEELEEAGVLVATMAPTLQSTAATLKKAMVAQTLDRQLRSRSEHDASTMLEKTVVGIGIGAESAEKKAMAPSLQPTAVELEYKTTQDRLKHALEKSRETTTRDELCERKVLKDPIAETSDMLEKQVIADRLKHRLATRPKSLDAMEEKVKHSMPMAFESEEDKRERKQSAIEAIESDLQAKKEKERVTDEVIMESGAAEEEEEEETGSDEIVEKPVEETAAAAEGGMKKKKHKKRGNKKH